MAAMTTSQLLLVLQRACHRLSEVDHVEVRVMDVDTLTIRVHLVRPDTFINVFYNVATDKTAFALLENDRRVYGVDNAKMGWHEHPFGDPGRHMPCAPMQFTDFLAKMITHYA